MNVFAYRSVAELYNMMNIKKKENRPYFPQTRGLIERSVQTIKREVSFLAFFSVFDVFSCLFDTFEDIQAREREFRFLLVI